MIKALTSSEDCTAINYLNENKDIAKAENVKYIPEAKCQIYTFSTTKNDKFKNTRINILSLTPPALELNAPNPSIFNALKPCIFSFMQKKKTNNNISLSIDDSVLIKSAKTISPDNKYLAFITDAGISKIYRIHNNNKHEELKIDFNSYSSNLTINDYNHYKKSLFGDIMKFSHDSKNLIIISNDYITLFHLENNNTWKVCSQLHMPATTKVSKYEENRNYLHKNAFNITDNNITIATLSFNITSGYPEELQGNAEEKNNLVNNLPSEFRGLDRAIYSRFSQYHDQIKIFSCDLTNDTVTSELKQVSTIDIPEHYSEMKLSPNNKFLLARDGILLSVFARNNDNLWQLNQQINITEDYRGASKTSGFKHYRGSLCKFNDNSDRLVLMLGHDQINIYTLIADKWEATKSNIESSRHMQQIAISKTGTYIVAYCSGKHITIFEETDEDKKISYKIKKEIKNVDLPRDDIQAVNISDDQKSIIISQNTQTTIYKI